ncbi:MAG: radical SAM protein [Elusimicrobiota bacterium]
MLIYRYQKGKHYKLFYEIKDLVFSGKMLPVMLFYLKIYFPAVMRLLFSRDRKWTRTAILKQLSHHHNERNPIMLKRVFNNTLEVCITYKCNIICQYCYVRGLEKIYPENMNLEDFKKLIEWAKCGRWKRIRIAGGEPTIHPEFVEMLNICERNDLRISIATNNLFSAEIMAKINRGNYDLTIDYNAKKVLDNDKKALYEKNIKQLNLRRVFFGLSYTIGSENEGIEDVIKDIKRYRPDYLRTCLALPDFNTKILGKSVLEGYRDNLFEKIMRIQDVCVRCGVAYYNYRPVPPCLFSEKQWRRIKSYSPFVMFHRCLIGYEGDFSCLFTVNPDLSFFPCVAIFDKGENILTYKNRQEISDYFRKQLKKYLTIPLEDGCRKCPAYINFRDSISSKRLMNSYDFFSEKYCQGACLRYHQPN